MVLNPKTPEPAPFPPEIAAQFSKAADQILAAMKQGQLQATAVTLGPCPHEVRVHQLELEIQAERELRLRLEKNHRRDLAVAALAFAIIALSGLAARLL